MKSVLVSKEIGVLECTKETHERNKLMKRTLIFILVGLAAVALVAGLIYAVLVAAQLAPAATTVEGLTSRRLWATTAAVLAMVGVVIGGLALARPASGRLGISVALVIGLIAVLNGGLNLAVANGGPGTGNGVVGAAGALVLGLIALAFGGLALVRDMRGGQQVS
jgi:FtsH-binding integral membrane protein